jgi:hypothetical protein
MTLNNTLDYPGVLINTASEGRAQTMFVDGVQEAQGADTDITGNLRTGIGHSERNANEGEIDNFEAADLAGVAASKRLLLGVGV